MQLQILAWVWLNGATIPAGAHLSIVIFWGPVLNFKRQGTPDNKVHGANMGPIWAPCWPHESCYQGRRQKEVRPGDEMQWVIIFVQVHCNAIITWVNVLLSARSPGTCLSAIWKKIIIFSQGNVLVTGVPKVFYILFRHPPDYVGSVDWLTNFALSKCNVINWYLIPEYGHKVHSTHARIAILIVFIICMSCL